MPKFRLVEKEKFEKLLDSLRQMIENAPELTMPDAEEDEVIVEPPSLAPRKTLADIIYERVTLQKFTPRQAYDVIAPYFKFKGNRYLDSIRIALKDSRFTRSEDGLYYKVK